MLQNVTDVPSIKQKRGLNTARDIFSLSPGESPSCLNVVYDYDAFVGKRLGTSILSTARLSNASSSSGYGIFDFGIGSTPQERRLIAAVGTGYLYSSDVGRTFATCGTTRTTSMANFAFVKQYCIACNDAYDAPRYWTGSAASVFQPLALNSAPTCKYPDSHQGYVFLLNELNNRRSVYYEDENDMFSSDEWSHFQLPTERNDEICGSFHLRTAFYVYTKYKLFQLWFVGGNPDWTYREIKNWGFVPRTVKKIQIPDIGTEVVMGLDWSKRLRVFEGSKDYIISSNIEKDNGMTPFYMDNINESQYLNCWAENDAKQQKYRLFVPYGTDGECAWSVVFDYRTGALYPENNRPFRCGTMVHDTADNMFMVGVTTNGYVHYLDSGNTDAGTAINDYFISSFLFKGSPSVVNKNQRMDLFFSVRSSGTLNIEERNDFDSAWALNESFTIVSGISAVQTSKTIDIRNLSNVYQFKVSSSSNTADSWELNRFDYLGTSIGMGRA